MWMQMANGSSIVKFEDLGKPATVLIEKISAAIEGIYKPTQIKRIAKAQAEADKIKAQAQIDIYNLKQRALARFVAEEAKKQENMENITEKALPLLDKAADPQKMEDDWITNFFDKCRIISDAEMQNLWARVLAGEANSPGTFSRRTVNLLGSLDKKDANLFTELCCFSWRLGSLNPLIYDVSASIYNSRGINFYKINHLSNIGLISFEPLGGYSAKKLPQRAIVEYFGFAVLIEFPKKENTQIDIGKVLLTQTGEELIKICGSKPVDGFIDYVLEKWSKAGIITHLISPEKSKF